MSPEADVQAGCAASNSACRSMTSLHEPLEEPIGALDTLVAPVEVFLGGEANRQKRRAVSAPKRSTR